MKTGTDKKGQLVALAVLLVAAAGLLWYDFASGPAAAPAAPAAVASLAAPAAGLNWTRLDPTLHLDKLEQLRARTYNGDGRDLFHFGGEPQAAGIEPGEAAPGGRRGGRGGPVPPPMPPRPQGPPPPPPIPLKFYGYAQANGMQEKVFLQLGDETYVVSQGETIAKRYLIENIGKASVRVRDLMTQTVQELPLQQG